MQNSFITNTSQKANQYLLSGYIEVKADKYVRHFLNYNIYVQYAGFDILQLISA